MPYVYGVWDGWRGSVCMQCGAAAMEMGEKKKNEVYNYYITSKLNKLNMKAIKRNKL